MTLEVETAFEKALWIESNSSATTPSLQKGIGSSFQIHTSESLESAASYLSQNSPEVVFFVSDKQPWERIVGLDAWMQKSLPTAGLVLVSERFSFEDIQRYSKLVSLCSFIDSTLNQEQVHQALLQVHKVAHRNLKRARMAESLKGQNKQLETMNESLEKMVRERTADIQDKKNQIELRVKKVKGLLNFIKELSRVNDIGELSLLLRKEVKSLAKSGEPYLAFQAKDFGKWVYTIHQGQLIEKSVTDPWKTGARLRQNDRDDQVYLANIFSKPIQKIIAFPLSHNEHQTSEITLFIEHDLSVDKVEELIEEIGKRAQSLALCLDRALLEIELKRSAFLWESTFDSIDEPIAITDLDHTIIRDNKAFQEKIARWFQHLSEDGDLEPLIRGISNGESLSKELRVDDHFYEWKTYPISSSVKGSIDSVLSLFVDTTQEKKLQSHMIQHEKMTAMGHLAGNIAHELNNPLAGLTSLSQILLSEISKESPLHSDLTEIELASRRSSEIIKNLLDFSNPTEDDSLEVMDLNELVKKTLPLLKSITSDFQREIDLEAFPLSVKVNPQLVQQVFFNLVNNACQAMGNTGTLKISTKAAGERVVLSVEDSGCGIDTSAKEKVFDPFYSTKKDKGGTGLGLSMSRNIVRSYGGEIRFESEIDKGTRFEMILPREKI